MGRSITIQNEIKPLHILLNKLFKVNRFDNSNQIEDDKIEDAVKLIDLITDKEEKNKALNKIVLGLVQNGKIKQAIELANKVSEQNVKSYIFSTMVNSLAGLGKFHEALETLDLIKVAAFYEDAAKYIVKGYLHHNQMEEANEFINQLSDIVLQNDLAKIIEAEKRI